MTKFPLFPLNPFASAPNVRSRWIPEISSGLFPSFEKLAKEIRLVERARSEGSENRPQRTDTDLDDVQRRVVAEVENGANALKQFLASQLHDAQEKIRARAPQSLGMELVLLEAKSAAAAAKLEHGEELETCRLAERRKQRELRKFQRDNRLSRDAAYASVSTLPLLRIVAIGVGESFFNAFLFMNATDGGWTAGAALAAICSFANVALGFLLAGHVGVRLLGHVKPTRKWIGSVALALASGVGLYWNLKVARFRQALEQGASTDAFIEPSDLLPTMDWFSFSGIESFGLFIVGLVVFAGAMLEGSGGRGRVEDKYWGYKEIDAGYREAASDYAEAKDRYKAAVQSVYQTARDSVRARHTANDRSLNEILEIAAHAEERADEVRDSIDEWIATGNALLRRYREENRAIRTAPAPAHFDSFPTYPGVIARLPDASTVRAAADAAAALHVANETGLSDLERKIADVMHAETERYLAEVDAVEERSEDRLRRDWSDSQSPLID